MSLYQIPNYTCISQGKCCSQHGGLITYIHNDYQFHIYKSFTESDIWEGLFVKVLNNKKGKNIYIGNIYRPPKENLSSENMKMFIDELNIILSDMRQINSILTLTGDFNIDLHKIKDRPCIKDYFENMLSYGMLPSIVLPTRVAEHSATLIDNIFTNVSQNDIHTSGIFVTDISDHFPIFIQWK